ncbi:GNAT family N-acetyltransferase, partial [Xanthomonas campestris]
MTPAGPAQIVILDPATQAGTLRALRAGWAASATEDSWDALDPLSLHLAARDADGELVAAVRLTPDRRIDRLGVLPAWRRRGLAARLLAA